MSDLDLDIQVKIPFLASWQPRKLEAATIRTIVPAMDDATLLLHREIHARTPVGATEAARGSLNSAVEMIRGRRLEVRGTVGSALPYIMPLETGSRPHWAPIGPLKLWAKRVLGDEGAAWAVQAKIAKKGTTGAYMFRDGFRASKNRIQRILQAGVDAWVRTLKGR